jgi:patatin-related protein
MGSISQRLLPAASHLDHLRGLWLTVGDIGGLLNAADRDPRSVLSGTTMLTNLYKAFVGMEQQSVGTNGRGLVDDVQCFATTTDLRGLPVPLRLADKAVVENRYRHVYRFSFSNGVWTEKRNDFENNDVALALASRSTSAFPAAFPPVRVNDPAELQPMLELTTSAAMYPDYPGTGTNDGQLGFRSIFDARQHGFADGGILNNKPFGHAVSALGSRRGGKPSERKLIYVEPSPEIHIEMDKARSEPTEDLSKPDFFSVIQQALSLPSEQTIREDLERVLERNRAVDRMNGILADIPTEVRSYHSMAEATLTVRAAGTDADGEVAKRGRTPWSAQAHGSAPPQFWMFRISHISIAAPNEYRNRRRCSLVPVSSERAGLRTAFLLSELVRKKALLLSIVRRKDSPAGRTRRIEASCRPGWETDDGDLAANLGKELLSQELSDSISPSLNYATNANPNFPF